MATEPNKRAELRAAIAALQDDHIEYEYRSPWYVHHLDSTSIVSCRNCDVAEADCPEVATYIAAADPHTVLGLLDDVERLKRERDEARAELAKGTVTITATVDQQGRLEGFAQAALTGLLMGAAQDGAHNDLAYDEYAEEAVTYAQATIRAIDCAVGASSFAPSNEAPPR